jgi:hypothetical protein
MRLLEDLSAALLIFAALCCAGVWFIGRDGAQAGPQWVVVDGRE